MRNIITYLNERYPIPFVFLLSSSFACLGVGLASTITNLEYPTYYVILVGVAFAAFLLRLRVIDEFKDKEHDTTNYPNRPLQRKLVNANQLICILLIATAIELSSVIWIDGWHSLIWYSLVICYSILTSFEFFIGDFLKKHFTLYFLLHEVIFIFFMIWILGIFNADIISLQSILAIICFTLLLSSFEIVRKFELRYDAKKQLVQDTYMAVWGRNTTIIILSALIIISALIMNFLYNNTIYIFAGALSIILAFILHRYDLAIRIIFALTFITLSVGSLLL